VCKLRRWIFAQPSNEELKDLFVLNGIPVRRISYKNIELLGHCDCRIASDPEPALVHGKVFIVGGHGFRESSTRSRSISKEGVNCLVVKRLVGGIHARRPIPGAQLRVPIRSLTDPNLQGSRVGVATDESTHQQLPRVEELMPVRPASPPY